MLTFVLLAAALTMAGVAVVAIPLLRRAAPDAAAAPWAALCAGALLVFGSAALYVRWSNWPWPGPAVTDSPEQRVGRLARELEHDPDSLDGWLKLGNSYVALQEYHLALRAFEQADRLGGGKNAAALIGEAEALALSDESQLDGRAARLIERALTLAPDSGKALFFGAAMAARRGDLPLARARFVKLLGMDAAGSSRSFIEQQISAIDAKLAATAAAGGPAAAAQAPAADPGAAVVRVNVTLSPSLAAAVGTSPLFVFVRDPAHPGPPLAVKRLASRFPQIVALSSSDAMLPGRGLAPGENVQVVARIARSGNPVGASGDPLGEVTYQVGRDGLVSLVIDHLTP